MAVVIDASIAAIWFMPDERDDRADKVLDTLLHGSAKVPSLFWFEIRNIMVKAVRRNRLEAQAIMMDMQRLRKLPLDDQGSGNDDLILSLCARHGLSAYDASYLALALQSGVPLATADRALESAAVREGVTIFS